VVEVVVVVLLFDFLANVGGHESRNGVAQLLVAPTVLPTHIDLDEFSSFLGVGSEGFKLQLVGELAIGLVFILADLDALTGEVLTIRCLVGVGHLSNLPALGDAELDPAQVFVLAEEPVNKILGLVRTEGILHELLHEHSLEVGGLFCFDFRLDGLVNVVRHF